MTHRHHDTMAPMVEKRRGGTRPSEVTLVSVLVRLGEDQHQALLRWAIDEERALSAQVRKIVGDAIPAKYFTPPKS